MVTTKHRKTFCVWYKKTLKATGYPILAQEIQNGRVVKEYQVNQVILKNCDIEMIFNNQNTPAVPKSCGATTVLLVFPNEDVSLEQMCMLPIH